MIAEKEHNALKVTDLNIGYKNKKKSISIFKDINFEIPKGELIGVVGPNGIGKSTLLRTLARMQPALNGSIIISKKEINSLSATDLANQLSVVLTEPPISKNLTVTELVSLGRQPYTSWIGKLSSKDEEFIQYSLTVTDTLKLSKKKCFELSDGQLQRVMIARALAQDTPIILLDEPTTHLDLYHRAYILKLLKKLTKEFRKTIIFSSHEIDLAIQLSDKMLVMTQDMLHFNTPDHLIDSNCFKNLFPSETIHFDPEMKRFTIKK